MSFYADLANMSEYRRIEMIGTAVMDGPIINGLPAAISFMVEDDEKADRYMRKINNRYPLIIEVERKPGLIPGTIVVRLERKPQ